MDPAVASIIAAFISAAASVLVALIGKSSSERAKRRGESQRVYVTPAKNGRVWIVSISILALWLVLSPIVIHFDSPENNFFYIFIVTVVLSFIWPIKPWGVVALVLMLYAVNFLMVPIGLRIEGQSISLKLKDIGYYFFASGLATIGAWGLARWRGRGFVEIAEAETSTQTTKANSYLRTPSLADQIVKLNTLRESGILSDEEFLRAKNKLLDDVHLT